MKYLWQNYRADKIFIVDRKPASPYLEIADDERAVNPLPRLYKIFKPLCENEKTFPTMENALCHRIAGLDLLAGMHKVSLLEKHLDADLKENRFGKRAGQLYLSLPENERRIFLIYLQRHESAQGLRTFFFESVAQFFPSTKFFYREWERKFLLQVPFAASKHNVKLMELLTFCLLDTGVELEIFWQKPFGIIGTEMRIGNFVIY